ncbi:hypothetical protein WN48_08417 [Eufriesea mexicana]|uniref:Uncharacterized protein n=1 Tax=Eufriesea mexicana TaxID=516756 RepID=A0A310SKJ1_9HYME|nr:hypothetical protein WN48_08417 [Eufriesea mexicana]
MPGGSQPPHHPLCSPPLLCYHPPRASSDEIDASTHRRTRNPYSRLARQPGNVVKPILPPSPLSPVTCPPSPPTDTYGSLCSADTKNPILLVRRCPRTISLAALARGCGNPDCPFLNQKSTALVRPAWISSVERLWTGREERKVCLSDLFLLEEAEAKRLTRGNHGILAERRAARENSTAEIRQRELGEAVQLHGAARATGSAVAAEPGRGEGHGRAPTGAPGQALTGRSSIRGHRKLIEQTHRVRVSSFWDRSLVVECATSGIPADESFRLSVTPFVPD